VFAEEDDAAAVGEDEVAHGDEDAVEEDRDVGAAFGEPAARGDRDGGSRVDGEAGVGYRVQVTAGAVDDGALQAAGLGRGGQDVAPAGDVGPPPVSDDDDVAGAGRLDCARSQRAACRAGGGVDRLDGAGVAGDLRTAPHRADAGCGAGDLEGGERV